MPALREPLPRAWIGCRFGKRICLPAACLTLAEAAARTSAPAGTHPVMVNDRLDVALAANAHGVHLGTRSMPVDLVRRLAPQEFVVGVSCHSLEEALAAQAAGADYILLGTDFRNSLQASHMAHPSGLAKLREVTSQITIPVFALGGITVDRAPLPPERRGGNRRNSDLSGLRFGRGVGSRVARKGTSIASAFGAFAARAGVARASCLW